MKRTTAVLHLELRPQERKRLKVFAAENDTSMAAVIRERIADIVGDEQSNTGRTPVRAGR